MLADNEIQIYDLDFGCSIIRPISDPSHYFGQNNVSIPLTLMLDISKIYALDFRMTANQVKKIDDI